MAIDEDILSTTIIDIRDAKQSIEADRTTVRNILDSLEQIQILQISVPNQSGGFDIVDQPPLDTQLNDVMTDARRQEIYDSCLAAWAAYQTL